MLGGLELSTLACKYTVLQNIMLTKFVLSFSFLVQSDKFARKLKKRGQKSIYTICKI